MTGRVYLVGAGPGDPRLLTLRGAEALRTADVVVYDRLVAPAALELAPARAERIFAGKEPGRPHPSQAAINALLVEHAKRSRTVVRLKGGDPFVFGRGGEEALACARAGVPFEVVPGVSSAIAAPAAAGIPLTHRGLGRSVTIVTASTLDGSEPDWSALAGADTLVVLMIVRRLEEVARALVGAGHAADEPAAIVEAATTGAQRTVLGPLRTIAARARAVGISPPATLVVGPVVSLAEELASLTRDPTESEEIEGEVLGDAEERVAHPPVAR